MQSLSYAYDLDGNITTITDGNNTAIINGNVTAQKQCFTYDALNRLTRATTKNDSANGCTNATDLGADNYDTTVTYDPATGNVGYQDRGRELWIYRRSSARRDDPRRCDEVRLRCQR